MLTVVGSLNMDIVIKTPRTPRMGETLIGSDFMLSFGGKGANQATAAARLGYRTNMIGCVGEDAFGEKLIDGLIAEDISVVGIHRTENISTGVACITVNKDGDNFIIIDPGANFRLVPEMIEEIVIAESDVILVQLEIPLETVEYVLKTAKMHTKITILNPAPARQLGDGIYKNVDIITPNETECEYFTGIAVNNIEDAQMAAEIFFAKGVRDVVITLGDKGVYYSKNGKMHHKEGFKVDVVDTTAAGDSFSAALAVAIGQGSNLVKAMEYCCMVGALTVSKCGAQSSLPTLEEVKAFARARNIMEVFKEVNNGK